MKMMNIFKKTIFYITLFFMSLMFSLTINPADLDLWHRMAVGKIFSQLGNVLYHDIFSYFPTKPLWIDHEWLSGVVFYKLGHYFGDAGLLSLKVLIIFGIIVLIYKTSQLIHPEPDKLRVSWYFVAMFATITGLSSVLRCQDFTYLFFALWLYVLERVRRGENRLIWIFPATTLIWANMHGGIAAGLGLVGFYAVGEFLNKKNPLKYLGILALCFPFLLISPYGAKYGYYLIDSITVSRPYISEWNPLSKPIGSFYAFIGIKIQLLLLIPALLYFVLTPPPCPPP